MAELEPRVAQLEYRMNNHQHNNIDNTKKLFPDAVPPASNSAQSVTFVIGPSSNSDSASYDYVTTGTNDDVQIQAAIDALPSTGGCVLLREGTYTLGATVNIGHNGVSLYGVGKGTIITAKTNLNSQFFKLGHGSTQYINCSIRDIYFDGNQVNQSTGTDMSIIDNRTFTKFINNVEISGCYFVNAKAQCIVTFGVPTQIKNCFFKDWIGTTSGGGLNYSTAAISAQAGSGIIIDSCLFTNTSTSVKYVNGGDACINGQFDTASGYNASLISVQRAISNYVNLTSVGASFIGFQCEECTNNHVYDSGTANVAAIVFKNCTTVTGNYAERAGIACYNCAIMANNNFPATYGDTIVVDGASSVITGNAIGAGSGVANTYSGILLKNSSIKNIVTNNLIYGSGIGGNSSAYGIRENSSSDGPNIILGNIVLTTFATAKISTQNSSSDVSHNITS